MNEWVSELIFSSLFTSFMVWSFSPFFFQRKRFYTAVLFSRLLVVLVGANPNQLMDVLISMSAIKLGVGCGPAQRIPRSCCVSTVACCPLYTLLQSCSWSPSEQSDLGCPFPSQRICSPTAAISCLKLHQQ